MGSAALKTGLPPVVQRLAPYIFLITGVLAVYINSLGNQFLFDDDLLIVLNDYLRNWSDLGKLLAGSTTAGAHIFGGFYRPLQMLIYFLIYQATGPVPFGFHLLNIALHAADACLLYTLGRKLDFNAGATLLAVLLWALHPIHTEAITYISGTAEPLYMFFCLVGILVLFPDFAPRRFWYAVPLMLLGLMGKEGAVVLPLLAMSCLYYVSPRRFDPKTYVPTWPLWLIAIAYSIWRYNMPDVDGPQTYERLYKMHDYYNLSLYAAHPLMRVYTFLATLPAYLGLLLWPADLHMERDFALFVGPWSLLVVGGFAMCAAGTAVILRAQRQCRPLGWGLLWFIAAHFPDTGLLIPMNALFLEHWMYLPTAGLFLGIAETLRLYLDTERLRKFQKPLVAAALMSSLACGVATFDQNRVWHDPVVFYNYLFRFGPGTARSHNNLANAYMDAGNYEKAIAEYRFALSVSDSYAEIHHNLGIALLHLPDQSAHIDEAITNFERATEIDPNFYRSYDMLAKIYAFLGDAAKSAIYKTKADAARNVTAPLSAP